MKFFKAIGAFFKGLFTRHNTVAIVTTVERVGLTAGDITSGNIPGTIAEAVQTADAAKSIKVDK